MTSPDPVPGYTHDDSGLAPSPVSAADLELLTASVLFGSADQQALRTAAEVLSGQIDFSTPDGMPIDDCLARVRARSGHWIIDTCTRPYDERWLACQHGIALRHTGVVQGGHAAGHAAGRALVAALRGPDLVTP
ncbi:hypothetical protein [Lentzea californiensis]|uniref:hypothetical protein n=1 Tax=Lentzea californiensis TaxID=438851 RepID=UPI002165C0B2|nr:hypothetical protein [Lentzea californiensis]MCR3751842.1 hypothetical protein [Lentzea californiensis]